MCEALFTDNSAFHLKLTAVEIYKRIIVQSPDICTGNTNYFLSTLQLHRLITIRIRPECLLIEGETSKILIVSLYIDGIMWAFLKKMELTSALN